MLVINSVNAVNRGERRVRGEKEMKLVLSCGNPRNVNEELRDPSLRSG